MTRTTDRRPPSLTLDGGDLGSLSFEWNGDRYRHTWLLGSLNSPGIPLLESIESDGVALWPSSPPLQQIHQQEFDDGREVVFGVGMSGRGHWSASFTLVPELRAWIIELACRSPLIPDSLSCTYRMAGDWQEVEGKYWEHVVNNRSVRIEPITPSCRAALTDAKMLHLAPWQLPTSPPSTTQWAYRLRWIN